MTIVIVSPVKLMLSGAVRQTPAGGHFTNDF